MTAIRSWCQSRHVRIKLMSLRYIIQRIGTFILTVVVAATLNFVIPRLSPQDPIAALTGRMASRGQLVQGGSQLIAQYKQEFGLDKPLIVQYADYMEKLLLHGDMGYSLAYFPTKVSDVVLRAVPWSLGLLVVANLLAFIVGNLLGALAAWRSSPRPVKFPFMRSCRCLPFLTTSLPLSWSIF